MIAVGLEVAVAEHDRGVELHPKRVFELRVT